MKLSRLTIIPIGVIALYGALALGPEPAVPPVASRLIPDGGTMIDMLPGSTVLAIEIRGLALRWPEISSVTAVSHFLDRALEGSGLEADDLPSLVGNAAIVALVPSDDRASLTPLALLRPPDIVEAEAILKHLGPPYGSWPLRVHRARGALWIGLSETSGSLERIANGDGTSARDVLMMHEAYRRLPAGGLVRGWINPRELREFLGRDADRPRAVSIEILESFAIAELEAMRYAAFRRELDKEGVTTDIAIGLDPAALPQEVARALHSTPEAPLSLPALLPEGILLASSFRTEPDACLAWLLHVSESNPRGPLRNLDFWRQEIEDRMGIDPGDLADALGDRGWILLLEGDTSETLSAVAVLEARDPLLAEETLMAVRGWLIDHMRGRTLGTMVARIRDEAMNGWVLRGLKLGTPFMEVPGPAFLVTDEHLVIGSGRIAVEAGLRLLESREAWDHSPVGTPPAALERIRADGPAIGRWLDAFTGNDGSAHGDLASAVIDLLSGTGEMAADIWIEEETVRLRGRIGFSR